MPPAKSCRNCGAHTDEGLCPAPILLLPSKPETDSGVHVRPIAVRLRMKIPRQLRVFESGPGQIPHVRVLRAVAALELGKGVLILVAGAALLWLMRTHRSDIAEGLLRLLHISPDHHFAQVFLRWAGAVAATKRWKIAAAAGTYSVLRFLEAYGLWNARAWAEWVAMISGAIYVPFEIHEIVRRPTLFHAAVFVVNVAIVLYMGYLRLVERGGGMVT